MPHIHDLAYRQAGFDLQIMGITAIFNFWVLTCLPVGMAFDF
jgi:hypothetical protein